MRLPAHEFLRRFLQHVLPKGLHRVRSYGLLHGTQRLTLRRLQLLLGAPPERDDDEHDRAPRFRCPRCHEGGLILVQRLTPDECFARLERQRLAMPRGPPPATQRGGPP